MHWLQFRGPNASGIALENANPTVASDGERTFSMLPGFGVVACNLTGARDWEYKLKTVSRMRWGGASATPVLWNDLIILHHSNEIIVYNLHNGTLEWWLSTLTLSVGTPVIKDDMLYVVTWTNMGEKSLQGKFVPFMELVGEVDKNGNKKIERDELSDDMKIFQRPERTDKNPCMRFVRIKPKGKLSNSNLLFSKLQERAFRTKIRSIMQKVA